MRICPHCETPTLETVCPEDGYQTVDVALFMQPEHDPFVGTEFQGRYRIDERLAIGGMGTVYKGRQIAVGRTVAIKILRTEVVSDLRVVARFQDEALAVAGLHHPNTVRIFDFGQSDQGHLFLVMEFIEGEPLGDLIDREAPLDPARVIHIGGQILAALSEAHEGGIVHRDLKPDNVVVTRVGLQPDFVKILDFGIAKWDRGEARKRQITETGIVVGSPGYMAPEQVQALELTGQVDIYAVGAVMWEMLSGEPVFSGDSAFEIAMKQVNESPPPPSVNGRELEGPLVDCIMSFLEKEPNDRPRGAAEALRLLQNCVQASEDGPVSHVRPVHLHGEEDPDVALSAGRPRRSTSVFFSHGQGMTGFTGHGRWILLLFVLVGALAFGGYKLMGQGTATTPSLDGQSSAKATKATGAKVKPPTPIKKKVAPAKVKAKAPVTAKKNPKKTPAKPPAKVASATPTPKPPTLADEVWVKVVARPKGTRIYKGRELLGKTEVVVKWPRGEKPPRLTLKKYRYESYSFRVPRRKIGKSHRVRLEWDDSR